MENGLVKGKVFLFFFFVPNETDSDDTFFHRRKKCVCVCVCLCAIKQIYYLNKLDPTGYLASSSSTWDWKEKATHLAFFLF